MYESKKGDYMTGDARRLIRSVSVYVIGILFIFLIPIFIMILLNNKGNNVDLIKDTFINDKSINRTVVDYKTITVYYKGKIEKFNLEDDVVMVVAGEMPANFDMEALKAQSILARTFAISRIITNCPEAKGAQVCSTTHCQVYVSEDERIKSWGSKGNEYLKKIKEAVNATKGMVLSYNGSLAMHPQYFAVSSGRTEESAAVFSQEIPYLKSVSSPGEEEAPKYKSTKNYSVNSFISLVNSNYPEAKLTNSSLNSQLKILSRNKGGTVKEIKLGSITVKGTEFRKLFSLNSANFTLNINSRQITINCLGYGHGVGMSQWGANAMAKDGKSYEDILEHYYNGCKVEDVNKINFDGKY
jgi:stage II sporulation protein D